MSVQLVLFPQESINNNQFLVDGLNFTTINASSSFGNTGVGVSLTNAIANAYPTQINTWYRFRSTNPGTPTLPSESSGNLTLYTAGGSGSGSGSGVYQNINNLIAGETYTLSATITAVIPSATFQLVLAAKNSSNQSLGTAIFGASDTTQTLTFTASSGDNIVSINSFEPSLTNTVIIESMSLSTILPPDYTGQVICDLYEDEEIPLTLSVDNFKNIAEKIQSYSKDFNLPATKRNNKIFGNIFEITRTVANPYDFNPYVFTRAVLKQDGFILFDGALRLIDIQDKEGEISYNVNLYAQTIALADILKNRTFDNIDFSELEHAYTKVQIKASWYTDGLPLVNPLPVGTYAGTAGASVTDVLKYPFVDWTHQMLYSNGATGNNANLGFPELTNLEQAFRPWIKIKYLLDRIFSEAGYTYSSSIFESSDFRQLFMDFNWGGDKMPNVIGDTSYTATRGCGIANTATTATFEPMDMRPSTVAGSCTNSNVPPDFNTTGSDQYSIVGTTDNVLYEIEYNFQFYAITSDDENVTCKWELEKASGAIEIIDLTTFNVGGLDLNYYTGSFSTALSTGDKLTPFMKDDASGQANYTSGTVTYVVGSSVVSSPHLNTLRGELNQWDFLKGLLTMFNLVTLQDKTDPANIIIEPYGDVFITTTQGTSLAERSIQHDWTDKVDLKDVKLKPLNDLKKKTIFKYDEESDDYIFNVYKRSTRGHLYGSKVFDASGLTLLEGEDEIIATPFAATISKPLTDQLADFITPAIYSRSSDGTTGGFNNKPRILYNTTGIEPATMSSSYYIPSQNGGGSENSNNIFTFSHLTAIPTVTTSPPATTDTVDYNFGECQYINPIGDTVSNNLFNTYWLPYYNQLYDPDTKTMTLKVNLQPADIATFKFSDYVMIKNRSYRVNRIDYKPSDLSTVEFILIN